MNPERMRAVADAIEESGRFHYSAWAGRLNQDDAVYGYVSTSRELREYGTLRKCGTTGCIAGWAATLAFEDAEHLYGKRSNVMISDVAQKYLGLNDREAFHLFHGEAMVTVGFYETGGDALMKGTAIEAAKVLRMVADGEVVL